MYNVHYDKEGREVHKQMATTINSTLNTRGETAISGGPCFATLGTRQIELYSVYCGCGFTLDPGDCNAAVADLSNQLINGPNGGCVSIPRDYSYYSIRGSVVAFVCNLSGVPFDICGMGYGNSLKDVTAHCGEYIAGTEEVSVYQVGIEVGASYNGYMRYSNGLDFCANAATSPAGSC